MKSTVPAFLAASLLLAACSSEKKTDEATATTVPATSTPAATTEPSTTNTPTAPAGFDPSTVPISTAKVGAFPLVTLLDGYQKMTLENSAGNSSNVYLKDVAFDRYEFFDGVKLVPVEGRLYTVQALGKNASFYQVQKTYEALVKGMGGVTVYEGKAQKMKDLGLKFEDGRHRGNYDWPQETMGVYMVRLPDREIWVEPYRVWGETGQNYWLTVVEKKALPMQVAMLPAEQLKKELETKGHVALYLNFDTDKASIKPESGPVVDEVAKLLKTNPSLRLAVEGYTDNAGTPAHNQQLAEARARAVVAALTAQAIEDTRLKAVGYGQSKPLADNSTEEGKAKNRRVELVRL